MTDQPPSQPEIIPPGPSPDAPPAVSPPAVAPPPAASPPSAAPPGPPPPSGPIPPVVPPSAYPPAGSPPPAAPPPGHGAPPPGYYAPPPGYGGGGYGGPPPYSGGPAAYGGRRPPVATFFDRSRSLNRLWGIPLLGIWIRAILVIPHVIVLWLYAIAVGLLVLVMWIPVLVSGRYPSWGYSFVGGYLRWYLRVQAYVILVAATYPPFSGSAAHDVNVIWDEQQTVPRWAGIPLIGVMIRGILLIPHFIVIWLIGIAVAFVSLFTWIPVLLFGRYPDWGYTIVGGFMAYQMRLTSYMLLLTGPYPRFGFED